MTEATDENDDDDPEDTPIFTTCQVCGRGLVTKDEYAMGMCLICAAE